MISTDSLPDNTAFGKKENTDFPILSDASKATSRAYGVLRSFGPFGSMARRWTFYIGPDGTIVDIDRHVRPRTAGADVVSTLRKLKVSAATR